MNKQRLNLSIDPIILDKIKRYNINISENVEMMLKRLIGVRENDIDGINLELLNIEITALQDNINKETIELREKMTLKENIEKKHKEIEENKLKQEKERIENSMKCLNCKNTINEKLKFHRFALGVVCNSCFMTCSATDIKAWNKKE